jgi:hypothetical protein
MATLDELIPSPMKRNTYLAFFSPQEVIERIAATRTNSLMMFFIFVDISGRGPI